MTTSTERISSAIYLEEPDAVPISDIGVDSGVIGEIVGRELKSEGEWAKALAEIGFDMVVSRHRILGHGQKILGKSRPDWEPRWLDESKYIGEWGEIRKVTSEMETPVEGTIKNQEDLDEFQIPDPERPGRIDPVKEAVTALGEDVPVFALIHDAFELPWIMRGGISKLITDYHRNPRLAKRLAEISTDFNIEMAMILLDAGASGIVTGDDYAYASGPFMTPDQFRTYIYPYLRRLIRSVHARGAPFIKHTDGMIWPIMGDILKSGPDVLNPIQPEAGMELSKVKSFCGDRVALMGNVDCGTTLHYGSVEDVHREVVRSIKEGAPGGGFILSSSNTIYRGTRPENLRRMITSAVKSGRYR